jgi:transcriptional regulator with XRE-family HTH domain
MSTIGEKIRRLRKEARLTARQLSEEANLSPSMLSQVERDIVSPSISSLRSIAAVLNVPAFYFFIDEDDFSGLVVRRSERITMRYPNYNATYQLLSPTLDKNIEMLFVELGPGERSCDTPTAHEGEECLLVISGCLRVVTPDWAVVLEEGDSIYLERMMPHQMINDSDQIVEMVCAISPPSY